MKRIEFTYEELRAIAGALHHSIEDQQAAIDELSKIGADLSTGIDILEEYKNYTESVYNKIVDCM